MPSEQRNHQKPIVLAGDRDFFAMLYSAKQFGKAQQQIWASSQPNFRLAGHSHK